MNNKTALIAGATGLIGGYLLELILKDDHYSKVIVITRNPAGNSHKKLSEIIVDFDQLDNYKDQMRADDIFCCLGTTTKKAGSDEIYRKVDHDYPLKLAQITFENRAQQYLLVSSIGSNPNSKVFYTKLKGEVEEALKKIGFDSLKIFRPSQLLGKRKDFRLKEEISRILMTIFSFVIPLKYKAVHAEKVAKSMLIEAKKNEPGIKIITSEDIQQTKE